jgi:hypothetical protein
VRVDTHFAISCGQLTTRRSVTNRPRQTHQIHALQEDTMTAVVLHLSDIHIRSSKDWILDKADRIAPCAFGSLPEATAVFIVVSGDIAWSGRADEYTAAKILLLEIRDRLRTERDIPVHFVITPGNHDCDFSLNTNTRRLTIAGVLSEPKEIDESVIDTGCAIQIHFQQFVEELHSVDETRVGDKLWTSHRFTVEGKELIFDALNVSWCSRIREEPGTLVFPHERYKKCLEDVVDLRVTVIHHPLNWFSQAVYHPFKQMLRSLSNVIISGHEHVGGVGEDMNADSGHSAYIEGCVLQDDQNPSESSFNVAEMNLIDGTYRSTKYVWDTHAKYYRTSEEGSWSDFRSVPKKAISRLPLNDSFHQLITDPGAAFQSSTRSSIKLADLYVYPDMKEPFEKAEVKRILSTSVLQDLSRIEGGALLAGEEKVGASSLLYMLFAHFHDVGLMPIYVRGADLKSATERDVDIAIHKSVIEQYGEAQFEKFLQLSSAKKVLLLDDFDDGPIKSNAYRARLLVALSNRFKYFIVVVSELFDHKASVAPHADGKLGNLSEFRLLPFGFTLRAQLVTRWIRRTADDGSLDEGALLARCDQAERLLDAVLARNIVPALPLYLQTLLQSIDAGVSGGFEESGLGDYYDFLIKEGMRTASIPKRKWGGVIEYCSHLAWQMHATEHKELSLDEFREFNSRYSNTEVTVNAESRLDELLRARVLSQSGDYVRFRYHYIYYFLKGRFLSSKLDDLAVLAHVQECCAHLYVRENANTILFLAHHAFNQPVFLDCVVNALNEPFKSVLPVAFMGTDTNKLAEFVRDLPAPKYTGEDPEQVRERENNRRDRMEDDFDGMADKKQDGDELTFIPQMVSLFKTVEILGQILKNQIATVGRARRVELLQLLMKGPLRVARAYFDFFMTHSEQAQGELAALLAKQKGGGDEQKRQDLARKILAQMLQYTSYGFIAKTVSSISSNELIADIESAAKLINTPAAKLIAVGVRLDSPKNLPRAEIRKLLGDVKSDFIATRVLQMLTLQRLYMFRTTEQDKQWLDGQSLLGIQMQHVVDLQARGTRRLK